MTKKARRLGYAGFDVRHIEWTQGTSGLKMEPKCTNRFEWRNRETLMCSLEVGGSQETYNAQEERMPEEAKAVM